MNVFFELADCMVDPKCGKHFAAYGVRKSEAIAGTRYLALMQSSDRAWAEEDDGTVRFLKHRFADASITNVDMKEFFWIKLRSVSV
jgi:hypothetical protein